MTEHFTVAILEELRRIGVELDRVAEPLSRRGSRARRCSIGCVASRRARAWMR
jgi:hypothetical protein